jgi:regulator of sigma E protease
MAVFYFILGILMFIGLVLFHEFGHFIFARRNGVDVEEFGLGFPPRAKILKKHNGTIYSLNWLPLGGFVKLKGEHDQDTEPGTFGAANSVAKTKIMLAGVVMNLIAAFVLFTIVAATGMPKLLDNQFTVASDTKITKEVDNKGVVKIDRVVKDSPADKAGLKADERIISINGIVIDKPGKLSEVTNKYAGQKVSVITASNTDASCGNEISDCGGLSREITLNKTSPYLGVAPYSAESGLQISRSTWSSPIVAVGVMKDFTIATFKGLGTAIKGLGSLTAGFFTGNKTARQAGQEAASTQVSGPIGIFSVLYEISKQGLGLVAFIIAIISLTLAIMNVLPIPALDGGRLFVMLLYHALKKPLKQKTEERIHGTGFAVLMLLFLVITVVDIRRFF